MLGSCFEPVPAEPQWIQFPLTQSLPSLHRAVLPVPMLYSVRVPHSGQRESSSIPSSFWSTELGRKRKKLRRMNLKAAMDLLNKHVTSALPSSKEHSFSPIPSTLRCHIKPHGQVDHLIGYPLHNLILKELPILTGSYPRRYSASNPKYLPPIVVMIKHNGDVEADVTRASLFSETAITTPTDPLSATIPISSINPKLSARLLAKCSRSSHPPLDFLKQHPLFNWLGDIGIRANIDRHLSMFVPCPRRHDHHRCITGFRTSS